MPDTEAEAGKIPNLVELPKFSVDITFKELSVQHPLPKT